MKRVNFRKGAGTFLEFSITSILITFLLIFIIGIFIKQTSAERFDLYTTQLSRDIVVCKSMKDAKKLLKENSKEYFSKTSSIKNVKVEIDYTLGSEDKWKKGNYVTIEVTGDIKAFGLFGITKYTSERMMMIEKGGS